MNAFLRLGVCAGVVMTSLSWWSIATAQSASLEPGASPAAPSLSVGWGGESSERDRAPLATSKSDGFKPLAITLNPLTLLLGRYGANVELLPAKHHALVANPYFGMANVTLNDVKTSYSMYGGELGYHFYSGSRGANGFYVGPSFIYMRTREHEECGSPGCSVAADMDFSTYGMAVDLGGQWVADSGFTIGGGGGLMYLRSDATRNGNGVARFEGVLPRLLFTIGYSL
jgi:hypothetical protein